MTKSEPKNFRDLTSLIRIRIAHSDGHYAGNLVDGAKMLQLFGDVATDLLIQLDGDEGLFRAYEKIEFLAPVVCGDYIEAEGKIIEVGNTSRKMELVARKVIQNLTPETGALGPSSAEVLKEPVVVCRAIGVCVTPKNLKRH